MSNLWTFFRLQMDFSTKLCGSVPADPDMVKKWLESRKPATRPPDTKSIDETAQEVLDTVPEEAEAGLLVFQTVEGGLVVRAATVRAHFKDCARTLSRLWVGKIEKEMSFAQKILQGVYHDERQYWLPVLSQENGKQVTEANGRYDKAVHAVTPKGNISALKTLEYVENARVVCMLKVLTTPKRTSVKDGKETPVGGKLVVSEDDLQSLFDYGGTHGYGGERSDGEGRYVATLTRIPDPQ